MYTISIHEFLAAAKSALDNAGYFVCEVDDASMCFGRINDSCKVVIPLTNKADKFCYRWDAKKLSHRLVADIAMYFEILDNKRRLSANDF